MTTVCDECYSHIDKHRGAPFVPLVPYMVFEGKDVLMDPCKGKRPLHQQASDFRGNPHVDGGIWFHCRARQEEFVNISVSAEFKSPRLIQLSPVLTDVLQHEAGHVGAAAGRTDGCDVDDVVGEEFKVGQVAMPHLREKKDAR